MFSSRAACSLLWPFLVAIVALAWVTPALAQPVYPTHPELTEGLKTRISVAAQDSALQPWQREFMRGMMNGQDLVTFGSNEPLGGVLSRDGRSVLRGAPSSRFDCVATYDSVRHRMVIFGGVDESGLRNDVWALS